MQIRYAILAAAAATALAASANAGIIGFGDANIGPINVSGASATNSTFQANAGNCCSGQAVYIDSAADTLKLGGGSYAWGSAFALTPQSITNWTAEFRINQTSNSMYYAMVLQNDPRGAAALDRDNSGFVGNGANITPSYFISFKTGGKAGFRTGGALSVINDSTFPTTGLNYAVPIDVSLAYDGTTLTGSATDGTTTFTFTPATVDLQTVLGGSTAYVGFTSGNNGGTGTNVTFSNFTYSVPEPTGLGLLALSGMAILRRRHA